MNVIQISLINHQWLFDMTRNKFLMGFCSGVIITCTVAFVTPHKIHYNDIATVVQRSCGNKQLKSFDVYLFGDIGNIKCND